VLIVDSVQAWREHDGEYRIEWRTSQPGVTVALETPPGASAEVVQANEREGEQARGMARVSGLPRERRHFFRLADNLGNDVQVTERRLALQGSSNFRDFGGYATRDGRRVRWGHLFRSGNLCGLTESDLALFEALELDLICDFRREEEQVSEPSRLPSGATLRLASLPIIPGSSRDTLEHLGDDVETGRGMFNFMLSINRAFATEQAAMFAEMFGEILALDDARLLVHCAAGKDRTGFAVAMILLALGVPRDVVMEDYLLSAEYFKPDRELARVRAKYGLEALPAAAVLPMLEVNPAYLEAALDVIDDQHGSVEAYLHSVLGVDAAALDELKRRYLV
jgi:protein-tyrosine phosphatase